MTNFDDIVIYTWHERYNYRASGDGGVYNLFARSLVPRVYIRDAEGVVRYIFADNPVPSYEVVRDALLGVL